MKDHGPPCRHEHLSFVFQIEPGQGSEERALPRAALAEQGNKFSGVYEKVQPPEYLVVNECPPHTACHNGSARRVGSRVVPSSRNRRRFDVQGGWNAHDASNPRRHDRRHRSSRRTMRSAAMPRHP